MLQNKVSSAYGQRHAATTAPGQLVPVRNSSRVCQQHARRQQTAACSALPGAGMPAVSSAQLMHDLAALDTAVSPAMVILPGVAILAGAAALKFYLYSQLEYITAAMLTKYVPQAGKGATVIQLGGGTRELYYYPKNTMTVINVGENVNKGLMEQAGVTAAVPTIVKQQPITDLSFQPDASVDAVVALGVISQLSAQQRQQCLEEAARVLKPGMPLVFVEPVLEGGSPLRGLVGVSAGKQALPSAELQALQESSAFSYSQFDVALQGQDPHAVGVAVKSENYQPSRQRGDRGDAAAKKSRSKPPKTAKGFLQ
uniref:Methyltransferase type 11 domain-containing protein n=1 Tax=Tetradesmus obliquus TaxID=3088 RepID=A0A383VYG1_TETOB|eukprot:jgi/Sobl393_1/16604/SZX70251.1